MSPPIRHHKRALELRKRNTEDEWALSMRLQQALARRTHWQNLLQDENAPADRKTFWNTGVAEETLEIEHCRKRLKELRSRPVGAKPPTAEQQAYDASVQAAKRELRGGQNARYQYNLKINSRKGTFQQREEWRFLRDLAETRIAHANARLRELAWSQPNIGPLEIKQRIKNSQKLVNQYYRQIQSGGSSEQVREWTAERTALMQHIEDDKRRLSEMTKELQPKVSQPAKPKVIDYPAVQELRRLLLNAQKHAYKLQSKIESGKGTQRQVAKWEEQQPEVQAKVQTYERAMLELKTAVKQLDVAQRRGNAAEIELAQDKLRELEATVASWKEASDTPPAAEIAYKEKLEAQLASIRKKIQSMDEQTQRGRRKNPPANNWEAERAGLVAEAEELEQELESLRSQGGQGSRSGSDPSGAAPAADAEPDMRRSKQQEKAEPDRLNAKSVTAVLNGIGPSVDVARESISKEWKRPWPQLNGAVLQPPRRLPRLGRILVK